MEIVKFSGLKKSYGAQLVLDDINFSIEAGESVGLVGVNGAGKTTLIKSMLDFTDIDAGSIEIGGVDHHKTESRQSLAYLPERFNPLAHLSGGSFIKYMLKLHQLPYEHSHVISMLEKLDFDCSDMSKNICNYSKGMVQKVGLASAFLSEKPLLILDEPMSGLDPMARMCLKNIFLELKKKGSTLLLSTHLLTDAALICDRLIVLHQAKVIYQGSPQNFLKEYASDDYDTAFVNCISK